MLFGSRRVAIALAPLRQGLRFGQPAAATSFRGSALSICASDSSFWCLRHGRSIHGFMRWLRGEQEPAVPERQAEQPVTISTSPAPGDGHRTVSEEPEGLMLSDFSMPLVPAASSQLRKFGRLEGCKSDDENIYLFFERPSDPMNPANQNCVRLSKLYMRDTCQCSTCVSPTGLKAFATCDIPNVPQLSGTDTESIRIAQNGSLEITWKDDFLTRSKHTSVYPLGFLHRLWAQNGKARLYREPRRALWDSYRFKAQMDRRFISHAMWMRNGPEFAEAVLNILKYGLVFIRGVPDRPNAVSKVAKRLGPVQSTLFGSTWNVSSVTEEQKGAHSNDIPSLHQDLPYWHDMPRLQLLHCVQNDCHGGDLLYRDGARAAWQLKHHDPRSFDILCEEDLTFHYIHNKRYYTASRPVIRKTEDGPHYEVCWAPPFQGPFNVKRHQLPITSHTSLHELLMAEAPRALAAWSKAARAFKDILEAPKNVFRYRPLAGDCIIIDNRRILNGRAAYDGSAGVRRFRGTYISSQTLSGALVGLKREGRLHQERSERT